MQVRLSPLDEETLVVVIEPGDTGDLVELMDVRGNGFAIMGEVVEVPLAIIDGRLLEEDWVTSDHLLAIEAHELGHIRTGSTDEPTAEREGIRLLDVRGLDVAAGILRERGIA